MTRGVRMRPKADEDIDQIWLTIALGSVEQADKFVDELSERFAVLAQFPKAGRLRPELARDLRSIVFGSYVVFYSLGRSHVVVERVLHGARDIGTQMFET